MPKPKEPQAGKWRILGDTERTMALTTIFPDTVRVDTVERVF